MSLATSLDNLTNNSACISPAMVSALDIALLKSLQIRGAFPTSLNLLNKIKAALAEGKCNEKQLARMVSVDLVLALRLLSLANHTHHRKGQKPVHTLEQAVEVIGVAKVADVLADLSEAKNFNAIYLSKAVSVTMMQQAVLAAPIAEKLVSSISKDSPELANRAYISAILSNVGPLLLAFFRPALYAGLALDCLDDRLRFESAFKKAIRKSIGDFAAAAARTLSLPEEYEQTMSALESPPWGKQSKSRSSTITLVASAVYAANLIAHEICYFTGVQGVQALIRELDAQSPFGQPLLEDITGTVANTYIDYMHTLDLKIIRVPEYLSWFAPSNPEVDALKWQRNLPSINERINPFLYELRMCFKQKSMQEEFHRLPLAMHCTLNALIRGLNFDRAVFLRLDTKRTYLTIAVALGVKLFQPEKIRRFLNDPDAAVMPDLVAFNERTSVFEGTPLFGDGWPFVSFPAIWKNQVVGIFYADKVRRPDNDTLDTQEQLACVALAEEWRDLVEDFF